MAVVPHVRILEPVLTADPGALVDGPRAEVLRVADRGENEPGRAEPHR